jgi:hypothetical protein
MRVILSVVLILAACSGGLTKEAAAKEVDQLVTLYTEARPKFVVQKQEIEQASDCDRATKLRAAIDDKARAAAMSPEGTETITAVQMELSQAEKTCLAK